MTAVPMLIWLCEWRVLLPAMFGGARRMEARVEHCSARALTGPDGLRHNRQHTCDRCRSCTARWMSPPTCAHAWHLTQLRRNVVHDVVWTARIAAYARRHVIESQEMTRLPRNVVIGAGGVAAHPDRADQHMVRVVKRQSPTEHIYTADPGATHEIVGLSVITGVPTIGGIGIDWITSLQAVETATRLHGRVEVGSGKRQARQTKGVGGVSLLGRNHTAARPLIPSIIAGESHCAHDAIAVHHRSPHIQTKTPICRGLCSLELLLQLMPGRQILARTS